MKWDKYDRIEDIADINRVIKWKKIKTGSPVRPPTCDSTSAAYWPFPITSVGDIFFLLNFSAFEIFTHRITIPTFQAFSQLDPRNPREYVAETIWPCVYYNFGAFPPYFPRLIYPAALVLCSMVHILSTDGL